MTPEERPMRTVPSLNWPKILLNALQDALFGLLFFTLLSLAVQRAHAQSRPPAELERYEGADRAAVVFNGARPEFAHLNSASRQLPAYKIPLDPPAADITKRDEVLALYHGAFGMQSKWAPTWNGNLSTCEVATTKRSYQESVVARVNWWRALTGRPKSLAYKLDTTQTVRSQAAAVSLAATGRTTHEIDPSFRCFSELARLGAWGNLDGNQWTDASTVDAFVDDSGPSNTSVGHRLGLLLNNERAVGVGSNGPPSATLGQFGNFTTVLGVRNSIGSLRPDAVIAMPAAGFTLRNLLPRSGRWSYVNQDLKSAIGASVSLTKNGQFVPTQVEYRAGAESLNNAQIVWSLPTSESANAYNPINAGTGDVHWQVTIQGLTDWDNKPVSLTYSVVAVDPFPGFANWNGDQSATPVHEYYWPERDTYFLSASRADADLIDEVAPHFYRTWRGFYTWPSRDAALAADPKAVPVCRWFFKEPISSHFYSAREADCQALRDNYGAAPAIAVEETREAFFVVPPESDGNCNGKYQPVFRLFNNQTGTGKPNNHRYTAHPGDVRELVARGWLNEGIAFCATRKKELFPTALNDDWAWY